MKRSATWRESIGGLGRGAAVATVILLAVAAASPAPAEEPAEEPAGKAAGEAAGAEASSPEPEHRRPTTPTLARVFDRLTVTGSEEERETVPGSVHIINAETLREQDYLDIHRILRAVPGVNIQEEEGFGLRPNIGMRGTGVERSSKITLLEDGVLIAPAPYAAPAAYYFPTPGRMEAMEVRKGSASIRQGPYTNGGVLNLISTAIPGAFGGRVDLAAGDHDTLRLHATIGDSRPRWGWLLETYQLDNAGFKELDGGGETGVELSDYLGKLRYNSAPESRRYQAVEVKLGATDQLADETYLGLTDGDFAATPLRRYAGSQEDFLDTEHEQLQVRYFAQPGRNLDFTATAYRNDFFRNWHKLDSVGGEGISGILADPAAFAPELAIVRGEVDTEGGPLAVRNNRRDYYSEGAEAVLGLALEGARVSHRLELGARFHRDQEDRFQEDDRFDMVDGFMALDALGVPGSQSNRVSDAEALALFVQDRIAFGRLTLTPGVRFESIDYLRRDFAGDDPGRAGDPRQRASSVDEVIPGLGLAWSVKPAWTLFAGVHRGFSPPGPGSDDATEPEESVNWELGFRRGGSGWRGEVVAFHNDYDNLLGRDTLSGGGAGTGELFNGGAVTVQGLEASLGWDPGRARDWRWSTPLELSWTWTDARFDTSFETGFADWEPAVERGDELPYLPEHQGFLSLGLVAERWDLRAGLSFVDAMRTAPGQGPVAAGEGTDEAFVIDLAGAFELRPALRLKLQVRNLADELYVVARRPAGARPGLPRTALVGIAWEL